VALDYLTRHQLAILGYTTLHHFFNIRVFNAAPVCDTRVFNTAPVCDIKLFNTASICDYSYLSCSTRIHATCQKRLTN
jgi:hypothetical protein